MSEAHFGHTVSVETRRKISESKKGCSRNDIKGENNPAKRPEVREKISNAAKGRYVSDITRNKLSVLNLGKKLSLETRHKISVANKGKPHKEPISEETRQKLRVSHLGQKQSIKSRLSTSIRTRKMWGDGEYRKKTLGRLHSQEARVKASISRIGHEVSQSTREKIRASLMGHEFPEKTRIKWIKSMREALHARPNKSEKILFSILCRLYPGQWAFVGDWTMVLDGKCPDFVNRNGRKLIIELFGDYWHKGEDGKQRANIFSKFGYKTLIVWESELKNVDTLVVKIQDFVNEKS